MPYACTLCHWDNTGKRRNGKFIRNTVDLVMDHIIKDHKKVDDRVVVVDPLDDHARHYLCNVGGGVANMVRLKHANVTRKWTD